MKKAKLWTIMAQCLYRKYKHEALGIIKALMRSGKTGFLVDIILWPQITRP